MAIAKHNRLTRACRHCSKPFTQLSALARYNQKNGKAGGIYCSRACFCRHRRNPESRVMLACEACGKEFEAWRSQVSAGRKYCSPECAKTKAEPVARVCETCGVGYTVIPSRASKTKCCSLSCNSIRSATLNRGHRAESRARLQSKGWARKRLLVLTRDGFRCTACGTGVGRLHAHHVVPWQDSRDDSLENLTTLCGPCHAAAEIQVNPRHKYHAGGVP